ncbi:MAG: toxin-antitoxin system YwqK family antitoxin, partial [bacterium]
MAETISNSERINQYQCVDFLKPQPYQKVLRIYSRDNYGNIHAFINSYHENGQPKQYLKVVNSRAFGDYREWHDNGVLKLQAYVVGGEADIAPSAEATWLFDGNSSVWDKEGTLIANICYEKGKLQGDSLYYHPNGNVWKRIPYNNDEIDGTYEIYLENRQLLQCTEYRKGSRHGPSFHYWSQNQLASREEYQNGSLLFGLYYDPAGQLVSEINDGHGKRAVFGKTTITELQEFRHGIPEGEIR